MSYLYLFTPLKLTFDFTINTKKEMTQKWFSCVYTVFGNSFYRMTNHTLSIKPNIIYFANHRTISDFFVDPIVTHYNGVYIASYKVIYFLPMIYYFKLVTSAIEFFNKKIGRTDIHEFEKTLKRVQETNRSILIYPEGTRRHENYACDLKKGSIYYSYKNNSPIQFIITHGKDDINNEKTFTAKTNVKSFVYYSKVYDQNYEKYENMEAWYQYINSEWKTFFNTIYTSEHKVEDAIEKIDPTIFENNQNIQNCPNKKFLYLARLSIVSVSLHCISKVFSYATTFF